MSEQKTDLLVGKLVHLRDDDGLVMSQGILRQALGHGCYFIDLMGWDKDAVVTELISVEQLLAGHARFYDTPAQMYGAVDEGAVELHPAVAKAIGKLVDSQPTQQVRFVQE